MQAQELRIGNWVMTVKDEPLQIEGWCLDGYDIRYKDNEIGYKPIPLSLEILEKAGFNTEGMYMTYGNLWFSGAVINKQFTLALYLLCTPTESEVDIDGIQYLHQLQNLIYSLTGEELKLEL